MKQKISNENIIAIEKKHKAHPVMWIISIVILVVIVVTFIGAPIAGKNNSGRNLVFGSYDGVDIAYNVGSYFYEQVNSIAENYRDQLNSSNAYFIQFQVWRTAYDNAVYRAAAIKEAKNSGVRISGNAVDEAIVQYGPYMENGEFSENMYAQSSNTEKKSVRDRFSDDLYYSRFAADLTSDAVNNNEADFLKALAETVKKFRYTVFPFSDFPTEEIAKYGSENPELFQTIMLSKITVNSSKKDAEQIYNKLLETPDMFSDLAKNQSSDAFAEKGGEMGSRYYYDMKNLIGDDESLKTIFSLKTGEISTVIDDDNSWVIYRCDKAPVFADMDKDSDIAVVKSYMELYAKGEIEDYLVAKADNFVDFAKTEGFEKAAADYAFSIYETNEFPVIYGNPSISYYGQNIPIFTQLESDSPADFSGAAVNEFFLKSIDGLSLNDITDAIILDDSVVVFQLVDEKKQEGEQLESIPSMVTYASQNWLSTEFRDIVFQSDKFKDNFAKTFSSVFTFN